MSSSIAQANLVSIQVAQRFTELDLEQRKWEKFRNEQGGFDLTFGEAPNLIHLSARVNDSGDIVSMVKQDFPHLVLRQHAWFAFESFVSRTVLEHFQSVSHVYHEVMQYLYAETSDPKFEYNGFYEWEAAKKEFETLFGVSAALSDDASPTPVASSSSEPTDSEYKAALRSELYQLAVKLARGRSQHDEVKKKWCLDHITDLEKKTIREYRSYVTNAHGKLDFVDYKPGVGENENIVEFASKLVVALRESKPDFAYSFKSLQYLPPIIHHVKCLHSLSLEHTSLRAIPNAVFELPFLRTIQLNDNRLVSLPPISGSPLLEHISVQGNRLVALPTDIGSLPLLESLQAERNCIKTVPLTLSECSRLNYLNLSSNRISYIPPELSRISALNWIAFNKNPIHNVPPAVYGGSSADIMLFLKKQLEASAGLDSIERELEDDFNKAASDTQFVDIFFKPRGAPKLISAHRVFIAARCPKLYTYVLQLEMGIAATEGAAPRPIPAKDELGRSTIPLNDMDSATFELLKTWIYHDTFSPDVAEVKPLPPGASMEDEMAHQQAITQVSRVLSRIRKVAETYCLPGLIRMIEAKQGIPRELTATLRLPPDVPFHDSFKSLLNRPELSDATFLVNGEHIYAHKVILSSRTMFFEGMFRAGMSESLTGEIVIPNISKAVLWSILVYCYRGEVLVAADYVFELLSTAKLFSMTKLVVELQTVIAYSLDVDNILSIFEFAKTHNFIALAQSCTQFALNNLPGIKQTHPEDLDLINSLVGSAATLEI